jgi:hypothetical protein
MVRRLSLLALAASLLFGAGQASAQTSTTGQLTGRVTDDAGEALPGTTVTVSSPALIGGPRIAVTEADGSYNFSALAPGVYNVRAELQGFIPQERGEVEVRLNRTTTIEFELALGQLTESIEVTAETPVLDTQQVSTSQTFSEDYLANAAVGSTNRSYQSVLSQSAGVVGGSNPNVFGSTEGENAYFIDGMDSTDPVTATWGSQVHFDAIQEINFETAGFEAEFGRATGGVVNVITKSGGNDFSGTFDVRYRDSDFYESGDHFDPEENQTSFLNPAATFGGPVLRDELWFFAAAEHSDTETTPTGAPVTRNFVGQNYLGKLTWQISPEWNAFAQYLADPAEIDNANVSRFRSPEAHRVQEQGGEVFQLSTTGLPSTDLILEIGASANRNELNSTPMSGDLDTPGTYNRSTGFYSGNYTNAQFSQRDRDEVRGSATYFLDGFGGSHELKAGANLSRTDFTSESFTTGNGFRYEDRNVAGVQSPYILWFEPNAGESKSQGDITSLYLQDSWRIGQRLTVKAGVRYDEATFDVAGTAGTIERSLDEVQPRFGAVYDLTGDGKTLARASWGRYMHPSALTLPSFARTNNLPSAAYLSCSAFGFSREACIDRFGGQADIGGGVVAPTWVDDPLGRDSAGYLLSLGNVFSSEPNQISEDLEATYADELILGVEREIGRRTSVELTYVDKETTNIFEDTCEGNYPGTPSADAPCHFYLMANLPGLRREYQGWILGFESRFTDWMHVLASYTRSESKGNVEYTQNAGVDYDIFPDHFVNTYGYLGDHREHRVKLNGYAMLPLDFVVGFDAFWSSAFRYSVLRPSDVYGNVFVEPRGSREGDDAYQLDLEVKKGFGLGDFRVDLIGTVFNAFGSEQVAAVCQLEEGCAGDIALGGATEYSTPRRYEVGVRFEF